MSERLGFAASLHLHTVRTMNNADDDDYDGDGHGDEQ